MEGGKRMGDKERGQGNLHQSSLVSLYASQTEMEQTIATVWQKALA